MVAKNYLTVDSFKSKEFRKACKEADKDGSGGINSEQEFQSLFQNVHSDNSKNFSNGAKYEGSESELKLIHEAYENYKADLVNRAVNEYEKIKKQLGSKYKLEFDITDSTDKGAGFKPQPVQMPTVQDKSNDGAWWHPFEHYDPGFVMPSQDRVSTWNGREITVLPLPQMPLPEGAQSILDLGESLPKPVLTKAKVKEFFDKYLNK